MRKENQYSIGLDIGGTKIASGIVDEQGKLIYKNTSPTLAVEGPEAVMGRIYGHIDKLLNYSRKHKKNIIAIGVSIPGVVDYATGSMTYVTSNLPCWAGMPIRRLLEKKYNLPTWIENDGNSAAWGEKQFGIARYSTSLLMITVGTGIGGGLIINNSQIIRGFSGAAGNFGHLIISFKGPECNCGNKGCVEAYSSGFAIASCAQRILRNGDYSDSVLASYEVESITGKTVVEAALKNDNLARKIIEKSGKYIGIAAVSVCNMFNPELIVVGGGISNAGELLLSPMREFIRKNALLPVSKVKVVRSNLGEDAGLIGAGMLSLRNVTARDGSS